MTNIRPRSSNLVLLASKITCLTAGVLIALSAGLAPVHAAQPMQLKTSDREAYGTRELESGNYAVGIEKLETALARTATRRDRSPILNNLCVAYVATGDFDSARSYCDQAVENGNDRALAYNNRGVLNFTVGNIEDSVRDFELASTIGRRYSVAKSNLALAKS